MMTYEAVALADQNGRTYVSKYGTYNKEKGFVINPSYIKFNSALDSKHILFSYQKLLDGLFHDNCWSLKIEKPKPKKMTKEEIEKELGYEVEIIRENCANCTKENNFEDDILFRMLKSGILK